MNASIWPRGGAEAHEHSKRPQAIERGREGRLADAVIDHIAEFSLGDFFHAGGEILLAIEDRVLGSGLFGELGFFGRAHRPDHGRAERLRPLAENESDPARRRVNEDRIARLHPKSPAQQILRGEALQHHRRGRLKGNALRQLDETVRLDEPLPRVSAQVRGIGDPVAKLEIFHALADSGDFARALAAGREGKRGDRIGAAAKINVDEIDADRMVADKHFAARGRRRRDVLDPHHLGPANLVNPDSFCHGVLEPSIEIR